MSRLVFIAGEKLSLVLPESQDIDLGWRASNNINIIQYWGSVEPKSLVSTQKFFEDIALNNKKFFMIFDHETSNIIGGIGFLKYDEINRNARGTISLYDEKYFGKWYGAQAMELLLEYGVEQLGLQKIKLSVFAHNHRARASYKKVGFEESGYLHEEKYIQWKYVDCVLMEFLRKNWKWRE